MIDIGTVTWSQLLALDGARRVHVDDDVLERVSAHVRVGQEFARRDPPGHNILRWVG